MAVAKKWSEVEASEEYAGLSGQDKFRAKKEYWETISKPAIDSYNQTATRDMGFADAEEIKKEFFGGRLLEDVSPEEFRSKNLALSTVGGTADTILRSAAETATSAAQPILHPINTAKTLGRVVSGVVQKMLPGEQINEQYVDAIGKLYKDRYGSIDAIADTVANDPVGFLADVATAGAAASGALKGAGAITKSSIISRAGTAPTFSRITKSGVKAAGSSASNIPSAISNKIFGEPDARIYKGFERAFPATGKTIKDLKNRKQNIVSAVKAMSENIPEDGMLNPLTDELITSVPKNRYEALIAAHNAKKKIWEKATALSQGATEAGATIDMAPILEKAFEKTARDYGEVAARTTKKAVLGRMLKEAKEISTVGKISPIKAQEFMRSLYDDAKSLEKSGAIVDYSMKDLYKNIYEGLRTKTDDVIESTLKKSGYNHYRQQYASLKSAEDAIKAGANRYLKNSSGGQQGALANFWSIEELLSGNVPKAIAVKGTSELIKYINNPDHSVTMMFKQAKKLATKSEVIPDSVLNSIKMLGK